MQSMQIDLYKLFTDEEKCFVRLNSNLFSEVKNTILERFGSLKAYNKARLQIEYGTCKWFFKDTTFCQLPRLIQVARDAGINQSHVLNSIERLYYWGSHNKEGTAFDRYILLDEQFVEGLALYLGEGCTGIHGKHPSRKFRFTISDLDILEFFCHWVRKYFPKLRFYIRVSLPHSMDNYQERTQVLKRLKISSEALRICQGKYNKKVKYRICVDNVLLIEAYHRLATIIKNHIYEDSALMIAYLRGIMAAEGTVYHKMPHKYVRVEMRNKEEILFISQLLTKLQIRHLVMIRSNRSGMWSVHIGKLDDIRRYAQLVGFGSNKEREKKLKRLCQHFNDQALALSSQ